MALELAVNVPQVVFEHLEPTRCLDDALAAKKFIGRDIVVTDFDPVSSLWMGFYDQSPTLRGHCYFLQLRPPLL
jgi:hypothetical protein